MTAPTPAGLLAAADPARPLLTWYDDATGERVELSGATTANWVAKIANLLQGEMALQPGERVGVALPLHWQTACVLLGCWSVGAVAVLHPAGRAEGLTMAFAAADRVAEVAGAPDVVALSLAPLGAPIASPPDGVTDFARIVPAQPDRFAPLSPPEPWAPAVELTSGVVTAEELVAAAADVDARVLTTLGYDTLDGLRLGLLGPLASGAGGVLCGHPDPAALPARVQQERVTATAGVDVPGVPRLG